MFTSTFESGRGWPLFSLRPPCSGSAVRGAALSRGRRLLSLSREARTERTSPARGQNWSARLPGLCSCGFLWFGRLVFTRSRGSRQRCRAARAPGGECLSWESPCAERAGCWPWRPAALCRPAPCSPLCPRLPRLSCPVSLPAPAWPALTTRQPAPPRWPLAACSPAVSLLPAVSCLPALGHGVPCTSDAGRGPHFLVCAFKAAALLP